MMPRYAVVTVNFGSSDLLAQNLSGLELPGDGMLILVDCFSSHEERQRIRRVAGDHGARTVLLDDNRGYGGGTNAGMVHAIADGAEVVVALNPDARIAPEALRALVSAAAGARSLVSPRIVDGAGNPWFDGADLYLDDGTTRGRSRRSLHQGSPRREWATGACFSMAAPFWTEIGGFDEDYFLYWEDIDLSHRVLDAGGELVLSDAVVVHDEGGTHGESVAGRAKSETYYYYNIRNRMMYASKHLDALAVNRWLRSAPRVAYGVLLQGGRRQLISGVRPWRAFIRGLRDGRRLTRDEGRR